MRVQFHGAALAELSWEVQYYAKISPQLGERFATAIERALAIAAEFPDMGSPHRYGTRSSKMPLRGACCVPDNANVKAFAD